MRLIYFCFDLESLYGVFFCAATRRDLFSVLMFPFICPRFLEWDIACLSLEISVQLYFFPSLFCCYFCSVDACFVCIVSSDCNQSSSALFLWSLRLVVLTLSWMLASLLPLFLNAFSLSTSSLVWKALCIVMSFVLWSICGSSSLVYFKNGPECFTWGKNQVFIPLMRFLLCSLASSTFLVLPRFSFLIFHSSPLVWWCPLLIFLSICKFLFLQTFWFSLIFRHYRFPLFIMNLAHFSLLLFSMYILTACMKVSNSFSFLAYSLMSSKCIRWLIFSCDFWSFIYSFKVFHISVSWWFFTGVWVKATLLKSPGLVSVFWPTSATLSFG